MNKRIKFVHTECKEHGQAIGMLVMFNRCYHISPHPNDYVDLDLIINKLSATIEDLKNIRKDQLIYDYKTKKSS